jgi:hypothetical protein
MPANPSPIHILEGPCSLASLALAALARGLPETLDGVELAHLRHHLKLAGASPQAWRRTLEACLTGSAVAAEDVRLLRLRGVIGLEPVELLSVALAASVERSPMTGRALAFIQEPLGGSRPTLSLVEDAFGRLNLASESVSSVLLRGAALASGLLHLNGADLPLVERTLALPSHVALALRGLPAARAGYDFETHEDDIALPASTIREAERQARGLEHGQERSLVLRTGAPREGRAVAARLARQLSRRPIFITGEDVSALAPWLWLADLLPVFVRQLGPSERFGVPRIASYDGPVLVICGPDGGVDTARGSPLTWRLGVPEAPERRGLWESVLGDDSLAQRLAQSHRHGVSRIAELGRVATQRATLDARRVEFSDVVDASCQSDTSGLEALAEPIPDRIRSEALVVQPELQRELDLLLLRCRLREGLSSGLGASASTRYRPGVRVLFSGPSGTGKTLAASWVATELGLPMYRVDVASVVSKYIGETEKNLAQLLAKAEHAEVVLLFDEADSLFGKRTDVKQANDRFANTQTNYLLQRIESYDGIVVLTTNSRTRLDSAFTRRLDFIIEFGMPGPDERRRLWLSHLGRDHALRPAQVNQLSALVDTSGGHIRNIVLCGAVLALNERRPIGWSDLLRGVAVEYRKLGKQVPAGLRNEAEKPNGKSPLTAPNASAGVPSVGHGERAPPSPGGDAPEGS